MNVAATTSNGKIRDELLDWDGGNTWTTVAPFLDIPSWWRRFAFRVLTPREFVVYTYIVSYCGRHKIARPLIRHMQADLNIVNSAVMHRSIARLVKLGFLLKEQIVISTRLRNVYKRPSMEHTLMTLLDANYIDGNLVPATKSKNASKDDYYARDIGAVSNALKSVLGEDKHAVWLAASDLRRRGVLYDLLGERVAERRQDYVEQQERKKQSEPQPAETSTPKKAWSIKDHPAYNLFFDENGNPHPKPDGVVTRSADELFDDEIPEFVDDSADDEIPF